MYLCARVTVSSVNNEQNKRNNEGYKFVIQVPCRVVSLRLIGLSPYVRVEKSPRIKRIPAKMKTPSTSLMGATKLLPRKKTET